MRRVQCYECGKSYDYDEDGFCPKCGAFNFVEKTASISADGSVVRRDGINERNHKGSFAHQELHAENRQRRGTVLEWDLPKFRMRAENVVKPSKLIAIVVGTVFAVIFLNLISFLLLLL